MVANAPGFILETDEWSAALDWGDEASSPPEPVDAAAPRPAALRATPDDIRAMVAALALSVSQKTPMLRVFSLERRAYVIARAKRARADDPALPPAHASAGRIAFHVGDALVTLQPSGRGEYFGFVYPSGARFEVAVGGNSAEVFEADNPDSFGFTG